MAALPIDLDAFNAAPLTREPFPFLMVPRFVRPDAMTAINNDFPLVSHPGSFPLPTLKYGPASRLSWRRSRAGIHPCAVEQKLGVSLKGRPTMVTARGQSAARDGQIHTDSRTKLITVLIYMNNAWEAKTGRLRLLRGPDNLDDVIAEVPPDEGTLLVFKNEPNAWHGFHAFEGPRRVIQLNWVTDMGVVKREQTRHRVSAFLQAVEACKAVRHGQPCKAMSAASLGECQTTGESKLPVIGSNNRASWIADAMAAGCFFHIAGIQRHLAEAAGNIEHIAKRLGQAGQLCPQGPRQRQPLVQCRRGNATCPAPDRDDADNKA